MVIRKKIACRLGYQIAGGLAKPLVGFVLFVVLFSQASSAQAQTDDNEKQRVAALVSIIGMLLEEDVERLEQPPLTLDERSLTIFVGASQINAVSGGSGTGRLMFQSADPAVASVDTSTGVVSGISAGITTITVTKRGDRFNLPSAPVDFTVTVLERLTQSELSLALSEITVEINATATNTVSGGDGSGALSFSSLNPEIATVDPLSGLITGISEGSTTITVSKAGDDTYMDATPVNFMVNVNKLSQAPLSFAQSSLGLAPGDTGSNLATGGSGTGLLSYSSDAPAIATVDAATGVVTAVADGDAVINAVRLGDDTYLDSAEISFTVTVSTVASPDCIWDSSNWDECNWQ